MGDPLKKLMPDLS